MNCFTWVAKGNDSIASNKVVKGPLHGNSCVDQFVRWVHKEITSFVVQLLRKSFCCRGREARLLGAASRLIYSQSLLDICAFSLLIQNVLSQNLCASSWTFLPASSFLEVSSLQGLLTKFYCCEWQIWALFEDNDAQCNEEHKSPSQILVH